MAVIRRRGWEPVLGAHAMGGCGSYSSSLADRLADFEWALTDATIDAIICTRGGYGAVQLLDALDRLPLRQHAKWLVGFSDISALHALMARHGIVSVHGPMTKHISANDGENPDFEALCRLLDGGSIEYVVPSHPLNRAGEVSGRLSGGNMAVLQGLIGTPFDLLRPDRILLIEDIAEPIYKVERWLYQLRLSGVLPRLRGLIAGAFTDYRPDRNHDSMEEMIREMVEPYDYPVAFNAPIGHGGDSRPLLLSAPLTLTVGAEETIIGQKRLEGL